MYAPVDAAKIEQLRRSRPFSQVARPQHPDWRRFDRFDVPTVLSKPYQELVEVIEQYRVASYQSLSDLPLSRIVTVLGESGAGKTHLCEAIERRQDGNRQLLVTRKTDRFDRGVAFEEYLFDLLLRALLDRTGRTASHFDALAAHITLHILVQALRSLGPTDRLFDSRPSSWGWLSLLCWGGGEAVAERYGRLADDLAGCGIVDGIAPVARRHQFEPKQLEALAQAHLRACETGNDSFPVIRRELYAAMIRTALVGETNGLDDFLEADYRPSPGYVLHRDEVVRNLLHAVIEVCALVKLPVVFAFDDLEGLLFTGGRLDGDLAVAFLDGLVRSLDNVPGFLCILFAEQGLFRDARREVGDKYVLRRLDQGVELAPGPAVFQIEIPSPDAAEVKQLVLKRMEPIRQQWPGEQLDEAFPFDPAFLEQLGTQQAAIHTKLEALHAEYERILATGTSTPTQHPAGDDTGPDLDSPFCQFWKDKEREAGQFLNQSKAANAKEVVWGLGGLLQAGLPFAGGLARLRVVQPAVAVGDDPRYGHVLLLEFAGDGDVPDERVAVGFLLAATRGMKVDLQAKLDVFKAASVNATYLIVLWATEKRAPDLSSALSGNTRDAWVAADVGDRACLLAVTAEDVRKALAFHLWFDQIQTRMKDGGVTAAAVRDFVHQECANFFPLVVPPARRRT